MELESHLLPKSSTELCYNGINSILKHLETFSWGSNPESLGALLSFGLLFFQSSEMILF